MVYYIFKEMSRGRAHQDIHALTVLGQYDPTGQLYTPSFPSGHQVPARTLPNPNSSSAIRATVHATISIRNVSAYF